MDFAEILRKTQSRTQLRGQKGGVFVFYFFLFYSFPEIKFEKLCVCIQPLLFRWPQIKKLVQTFRSLRLSLHPVKADSCNVINSFAYFLAESFVQSD